jgi:hypothetical protein
MIPPPLRIGRVPEPRTPLGPDPTGRVFEAGIPFA